MVIIPIEPMLKFMLYYKQFTSAHFISKAFRFSPLGGKLVTKKAKFSYKVAFEGRF